MPALVSILFGAGFTIVTCYALGVVLLRCIQLQRTIPAPPEIALAMGAAAFSTIVFLLLLLHLGHWYAFLAVGVCTIVAWRWVERSHRGANAPFAAGSTSAAPHFKEASRASLPPAGKIAAAVILGAYGAWYFVNALAPEILADGVTYHLGLPYEYIRGGGFPNRTTFYDVVPQGMEMLYTAAFAFGRHSAAKLVEFAFFLATVPLFFRIGRLLGLSDLGALVAVVFYFCAPVVGATGASSYTDASGVFFTLCSLYLLLLWRDSNDALYLAASGITAGFCYAIKAPGILTVAAVVVFVLACRRFQLALLAAGCAALVMAPWLVRNLALTGNPVAPLANAIFPNGYFHLATERDLIAEWRSLGPVRVTGIPWELAFGDRLHGCYGPLLLALPLALLALRSRAGRWCWAAAAILGAAWFSNTGARFLMPALAVLGLALGMVLPRPVAWAAIAIQAVLCWPQAIDLWETRFAFRLHEFPLAAALRIEPESGYLKRHVDDYTVAKMIEANTPPDVKILALVNVANAYLTRDVRVSWQSAESDRLLSSIDRALEFADPLAEWRIEWPLQSLQALRFRLPHGGPAESEINEVRIYSGGDFVYPSPHWQLRAWPNRWESPLILDGNLASAWRSWAPARAGTFVEVRFDHLQTISSAVVFSPSPSKGLALDVYGQDPKGRWHALGAASAGTHPRGDLRLEAGIAIRRAGYRFLLATTGSGGSTPAGNALLGHEAEWGMEPVAFSGPYFLYRVK